MKKLLLFSICAMLSFASCKKDSTKTSSSNTITATVGGSNINFSTTAIAQLASDSGVYVLAVQGVSGTGSSAQSIIVGLLAEGPIVKGTYTFNSSTDPNTITVLPAIAYTSNLSGIDADEFESNIDISLQDSTISTTATVTITAISSTNVQGTFSGLLINDGDNVSTKTVANGKFNVDMSANKVQTMNSRVLAAKLQSFKNRIRN
jgi:hypothetical protein